MTHYAENRIPTVLTVQLARTKKTATAIKHAASLVQGETLSHSGKDASSSSALETDMILAAMGDLRTGIEKKIEDLNKYNAEKCEAMKSEIEKSRADFNNRMEALAKTVEKQVMKSMTKEIDTKIKQMRTSINKGVNKKFLKLKDTTLTTMKKEMGDELDAMSARLKSLETKVGENCQSASVQTGQEASNRNIIIRNLSEQENENVLQRVNSIVSEGLKPINIDIETATRKTSRNPSSPGLIIATCKTVKDKENIMSKKREL